MYLLMLMPKHHARTSCSISSFTMQSSGSVPFTPALSHPPRKLKKLHVLTLTALLQRARAQSHTAAPTRQTPYHQCCNHCVYAYLPGPLQEPLALATFYGITRGQCTPTHPTPQLVCACQPAHNLIPAPATSFQQAFLLLHSHR